MKGERKYHDCQWRCIHADVEDNADYTNEVRSICGGVENKECNEDDNGEEDSFDEKYDQYLLLKNSTQET